MPPNPDLPATSVLLIDGNHTDRKFFADQLKDRSPDYKILEATNGEEGLILYRSRRIDCVVVALELPDQSGLKVLVDPRSDGQQTDCGSRDAHQPSSARTRRDSKAKWGLFMSGEDLDRAIQRAMAFVGQMPTEDRYRL